MEAPTLAAQHAAAVARLDALRASARAAPLLAARVEQSALLPLAPGLLVPGRVLHTGEVLVPLGGGVGGDAAPQLLVWRTTAQAVALAAKHISALQLTVSRIAAAEAALATAEAWEAGGGPNARGALDALLRGGGRVLSRSSGFGPSGRGVVEEVEAEEGSGERLAYITEPEGEAPREGEGGNILALPPVVPSPAPAAKAAAERAAAAAERAAAAEERQRQVLARLDFLETLEREGREVPATAVAAGSIRAKPVANVVAAPSVAPARVVPQRSFTAPAPPAGAGNGSAQEPPRPLSRFKAARVAERS